MSIVGVSRVCGSGIVRRFAIIRLMEPAVKIKHLSVTLGGSVKALQDISLELPAGKIIGFIGPSGAGKTTLIKSIVGRLEVPGRPVEVFGYPAGSPELRESVSYMTQELSVYPDLTVKENIVYFSRMEGQSKKEAAHTLKESLAAVHMTNKADTLVSELSGGQKQRVSLAVALIGSPKLMVLDEPTVGLDPVLRNNLWQLFNELAGKGTTLLISSHSMDEATKCDSLVLLREGAIVANAAPEELLRKTGTKSVEAAFLKLVGDRT